MGYQDELERYAERPYTIPQLSRPLLSSLIGAKMAERKSLTPLEWLDEVATPAQWARLEALINDFVMADGSAHVLLKLGDLIADLAHERYAAEVETEFKSARAQFERELTHG